MTKAIEELRAKMERAVLDLNFEEAKRYRDQIAMVRGGATPDEAESTDSSGLERQQPGAMGLGTSQQRLVPPAGWAKPVKPDPMTARKSARRRRPQS